MRRLYADTVIHTLLQLTVITILQQVTNVQFRVLEIPKKIMENDQAWQLINLALLHVKVMA